MTSIADIIADFDLLDEWEDRYRYLIELGRKLEPLPEAAHNEDNKVRGCASRVWVETTVDRSGAEPVLTFRGDSDAHIVRGLVCLVLTIYSHRPAREIVETDAIRTTQKISTEPRLRMFFTSHPASRTDAEDPNEPDGANSSARRFRLLLPSFES
jgi:cysteine desulfuration protein SufE